MIGRFDSGVWKHRDGTVCSDHDACHESQHTVFDAATGRQLGGVSVAQEYVWTGRFYPGGAGGLGQTTVEC